MYKNVINQEISYWLCYRSWSSALVLSLWSWTNAADLGPVTEPIQNHLIDNIMVFGVLMIFFVLRRGELSTRSVL